MMTGSRDHSLRLIGKIIWSRICRPGLSRPIKFLDRNRVERTRDKKRAGESVTRQEPEDGVMSAAPPE